jgi:hypothetical protein
MEDYRCLMCGQALSLRKVRQGIVCHPICAKYFNYTVRVFGVALFRGPLYRAARTLIGDALKGLPPSIFVPLVETVEG